MKKIYINPICRKALWLAHGKRCFYTGEPIGYGYMEVDHIIPSKKWSTDSKIIIEKYGLDLGFEIDGYHNLVPCKRCVNKKKTDIILNEKAIHFYLGMTLNYYDKFIREYRALLKSNLAEIISRIISRIKGNSKVFSNIVRKVKKDGPDILWNIKMPFTVNFSKNGNNEVVNNCLKFKECLNDGMEIADNYSKKSGWIYECFIKILDNFSTVDPPTKSFISDPYLGILDVNLIPSELFTDRINLHEAKKNNVSGLTVQDLIFRGDAVVKELTSHSLTIENRDNSMGVHIFEVSRGDFDNDKVEDILIYASSYVKEGSLWSGETCVLSRVNDKGNFIVLEK